MRKPRYPKDFDPKNPGPKPDPERWMPKWQRSGHKKSRRRRRDEKEMKGSQVSCLDVGIDVTCGDLLNCTHKLGVL